MGAPAGTQLFQSEILSAEDHEFIRYVAEYGKTYGTRAEFEFRSAQFKQNLAKIAEHNSENGTSTVGINQFTDKTTAEMKKLNGYKAEWKKATLTAAPLLDTENLADEINWVTKGAVTEVKNQGQCGSCWSFSSTGALEGAHFVKTGELVSLSESNLVDCSWLNHGCNGGNVALAYEYAEGHPLETEADYPYHATSGLFDCKYDKSKGVIKVTTWHMVGRDSAQGFYTALQTGPVSVAVEAD